MSNIESRLRDIENDLTNLFKKVIRDKKLVETGRLLNSISFKIVKNGDGYTFNMTAVSYFKYLDEKYGITNAAFSSQEFMKIQDKIADVYVIELQSQLVSETNR